MNIELSCTKKCCIFTNKFFIIGIVIFCVIVFSACSSLEQAQATTATAVPVPTATVPMKVVTLEPIIPSPTAPTKTQDVYSVTAAKNMQAFLAAVRQKLKTTGWIHSKYTFSFSANRQGIEVPPQIVEKWLRFDDTGRLVEAYDFNTSPEGKDMGGSALQNGQVDQIFYDGSVFHSTNETPFTINDLTNYYEGYLQKGNGSPLSQEATVFNGLNAWKFSYHVQIPDAEFIEAVYFDTETGLILGDDTYQIQPDGSLKFIRGVTITDFEIDAKPPLERFRQILERAKEVP